MVVGAMAALGDGSWEAAAWAMVVRNLLIFKML